MRVLVNSFGIPRDFEDNEIATKIVLAKKDRDVWEVIEMIVDLWQKKFPDEAKDVQENITQYREQAIDKDFIQTKDGKKYDRRLLLSFPRKLMLMIRSIYDYDELKMDEAFMRKFAKKYSKFRVGSKL